MGLFSSGLLPASFRGVPFAVVNMSTRVGRRLALHQYPGRDEPWAEDMGRGARRIRFRGFIVANDPLYEAGPIAAQRALLFAAAEAAGPGLLTHPTLGLLEVACDNCEIGEDLEGATLSSVDFSFIEAGQETFPSLLISSVGVSPDVVTGLAVATDAVRALALEGNISGASGSLTTVTSQWSAQVASAGADATALTRLTSTLPGNLGRYNRGGTSGYLTPAPASADTTIGDLIGLASERRAAISAAATSLSVTLTTLTVTTTEQDYTSAAATLIAALAGACEDPTDAIRLLSGLLLYTPSGLAAATAAGAAVCALFRRLVALELVRAAAEYQPASYEDAFSKLVTVTSVLEDAILAAGDAGQDDLFAALRSLRVAVVADFQARGASLAHIRTFVLAAPLPSSVLAQRFYRDASRSDELVTEAGEACVSPLFMPTSIQALAA